jgi:hypothetical protein
MQRSTSAAAAANNKCNNWDCVFFTLSLLLHYTDEKRDGFGGDSNQEYLTHESDILSTRPALFKVLNKY